MLFTQNQTIKVMKISFANTKAILLSQCGEDTIITSTLEVSPKVAATVATNENLQTRQLQKSVRQIVQFSAEGKDKTVLVVNVGDKAKSLDNILVLSAAVGTIHELLNEYAALEEKLKNIEKDIRGLCNE